MFCPILRPTKTRASEAVQDHNIQQIDVQSTEACAVARTRTMSIHVRVSKLINKNSLKYDARLAVTRV